MKQTVTEKVVLPELFHHVGVVVRDIEKAAKYYSFFGIGPFRAREVDLANIRVHGKPASLRIKASFAHMGPIQLELIQPLKGEYIYREFLNEHGEGLHHLCYIVTDLEAKLDKLSKMGVSVLMSVGSYCVYLDAGKVGGVIIELLDFSVPTLPWLLQVD